MEKDIPVIMPDGHLEFVRTHAEYQERQRKLGDWPWRGPRSGRGMAMFLGWKGWKPNHKHAAIMTREWVRLAEFMVSRGWELQGDMYVAHDRSGAIGTLAMFHLYVNGSSSGYTHVTGKTFWDVPDEDKRWYDLRIFNDEIGLERTASPGKVVAAVMERLPAHVDDLISHFKKYPGWETLINS